MAQSGMSKTNFRPFLFLLFAIFVVASCGDPAPDPQKPPVVIPPPPFQAIAPAFDADSAYAFIEKQLSFGPRIPNTQAHVDCANWMISKFEAYGAAAQIQAAEITDKSGKRINMKNIVASYNPTATVRVMLTAHWDSRPVADKDPTTPTKPVPGANDGASGVGIILEVARQFGIKAPAVGVDLILWDAEDNGNYNDNDSWCLGSQYWAKHPHKANYTAKYGINLDMVGAKDARYTKDGYSLQFARPETDKVWNIALQLGYGAYFSPVFTDFASIDDHFFVMDIAGIPMVEVIDRNINSGEFFEHWHRATDDLSTIDKATLKATGQTMLEVLYREK